MTYVWDAAKDRRNISLHGIGFKRAIRIFDGPTLEQVDDRFEYAETRIYAIGVVGEADLSQGERRTISAWKAERHEREAYWSVVG